MSENKKKIFCNFIIQDGAIVHIPKDSTLDPALGLIVDSIESTPELRFEIDGASYDGATFVQATNAGIIHTAIYDTEQARAIGMNATEYGLYTPDPSGLMHYTYMTGNILVTHGAADALAYKPDGPAWFWFSGTPAPMHSGDDQDALVYRWKQWSEFWRDGKLGNALKTLVPPTTR